MTEFENTKLLADICEIFAPYPEAREYVLAYNEYVHAVDDLIDENSSPEKILNVQAMATQLRATIFYRTYADKLALVDLLINANYHTSVEWENSDVEWKKRHADVIRHDGLNMFFAVVVIIAGYEKLRSISTRMREYSHFTHLRDLFQYEAA